jgi:uncharacterized cysteine cluster protein YcgN (CxxCxxCC family)
MSNMIQTNEYCEICDGTGQCFNGNDYDQGGEMFYSCTACDGSGYEHISVIEYLKRIKKEYGRTKTS